MTNAFRPHAVRVLNILGVIDQIEGVVSCNYTAENFACKPEAGTLGSVSPFASKLTRRREEYFHEAVTHSLGRTPTRPPSPESLPASVLARHFFVDDSALNIRGAKRFGLGSCVWFDEDADPDPAQRSTLEEGACDARVRRLEEVRDLPGWRECWKDAGKVEENGSAR